MSECRYFPLCDMSDLRCEEHAQCSLFEAMPDVARLTEIADKMVNLPMAFPGKEYIAIDGMVKVGTEIRRALGIWATGSSSTLSA